MESFSTEPAAAATPLSVLHQVTPVSKYVALALFVVLPFLGGYVGYRLAPVSVVEVETAVVPTTSVAPDSLHQTADTMPAPLMPTATSETGTSTATWQTYSSDTVEFLYPRSWTVTNNAGRGTGYEVLVKIVNPEHPGVADTDALAEMILVRTVDDVTCESADTGWKKDFGPASVRTVCFDGNINSIEFVFTAVEASTQQVMEDVIASITL